MVRRKRNRANLPKVIKAINDLTGRQQDEPSSDEESNTEPPEINRSRISNRRTSNRQNIRNRSRIDRFIREERMRRSSSISRARSRSRRRSRRRRIRRLSRTRQLERSIFRRRLLQNRNVLNSGDWVMPVTDMSDEDSDEVFNVYLIRVPVVSEAEFLNQSPNLNSIQFVSDINNNNVQEIHENSDSNTLNSEVKRAIYTIFNTNNLSQDLQNDQGVIRSAEEDSGVKIVELNDSTEEENETVSNVIGRNQNDQDSNNENNEHD